MSLSRPTAGAAANASSATITSTAAGDLILVFAYNATNNIIPTLVAGYTTITTAQTTNGACRVGYKRSTGSETTTGTWTSATQTVAIVIRSSTSMAIVNTFLSTSGSGTTLTYLGMTATNGAGSFQTGGGSWVVAFGGARSASAGMNGNTTNLTNEANVTTANGLDTEAGVSSLANQTLSVTTSGEWITVSIEVVEAAADIALNPTAGVTMYGEIQTKPNLPGYARKIILANDVNAMAFAQYTGQNPLVTAAPYLGNTDGIVFGQVPFGNYKRVDVGSPGQPSQLQHGPGRFQILIPVIAGARVITLDCRYYPDSGAGKRPRLLLRRDVGLGIADDYAVEAAAQSGTSFQVITISYTIAVDGVLEIYREQQDTRADAWTLWDNLKVT